MAPTSVRVEFRDPAPALRVMLPRESDPQPVWDVLADQDVVVSGAHSVSTELRVLVHAKLFDRFGQPLSQHRALELLRLFQGTASDSNSGVFPRSAFEPEPRARVCP